MGLLINDDATIFQEFFKELCFLRGISVKYIYPVDEEVSIHGQIFPKFSSVYSLDIIFESNPKIKTLKNYGWVSENQEDKPYIAYLPFDTPHIQTKARLQIIPIGSEKEGKWFEITDIVEAIEFPDAYVCRLAPVFVSDEHRSDYDETNNNYLDMEQQPDQNTNSNEDINEELESTLNKEIHDNNFHYLNL